ncbi:MAG: RNA polymerase sigma-70 factor [Chitinophagaceae bacterium]|nr:RNA polymerase sigma-70 factor [Chitinophagaceae bacterium]
MSSVEPDLLLRRIAEENDKDAFRGLYNIMHKSLYDFALAIVKLKEPAEEITADVFIRLWERRSKLEYGRIRSCRLYLFMCIKNASLNYLRDNKRPEQLNLDTISLADWKLETNPEELMITAEMANRLNRAISELPAKCGVIFRLVKEKGLSYKEAAQLLDVSEKTVENQIGIALKKIRQAISFKVPVGYP